MSPKTPEDTQVMDNIPYASAVGSLMYAMLCTRPDICHSVSVVSKLQSDLGLEHWTTVKHIFKYLRRTKHYCLVYGADELVVSGFTDADQSDVDDMKSSSGFVFTLANEALSWRNCKTIAQAKESRSHQKSKHVLRKYHVIREIIDRGDVAIAKVASADNMTDPFAKPLSQKVFDRHVEGMGLRYMNNWL
ncbi:secreted RxLR effector protein 161-like [Tasmannia lanceolata]|uniref:secreted RxLR effector protein 161-like n=1 Tax=Tasmannia lanceolata TaxID=3420 RepID=UPI0040637132